MQIEILIKIAGLGLLVSVIINLLKQSGRDELAALEAMEAWCLDNELPLAVSDVPADRAPMLLARYPLARIMNLKSWLESF